MVTSDVPKASINYCGITVFIPKGYGFIRSLVLESWITNYFLGCVSIFENDKVDLYKYELVWLLFFIPCQDPEQPIIVTWSINY